MHVKHYESAAAMTVHVLILMRCTKTCDKKLYSLHTPSRFASKTSVKNSDSIKANKNKDDEPKW